MLAIVPIATTFALAGPFARRGGLFAGADSDGDGIPDRRDACLASDETWNGYADDDGCPDHLAVLDVWPRIGPTAVRATVTLHRDGDSTVVEPPRVADDLVPGERLRVDVEVSCFVGTRRFTVQRGRNRVDVALRPRLDRPTSWLVTDPSGELVPDVTLRFDGACAPRGPLVLPDGEGMVYVGDGVHPVAIAAPGYEPTTRAIDSDDEVFEVVLSPRIDRAE